MKKSKRFVMLFMACLFGAVLILQACSAKPDIDDGDDNDNKTVEPVAVSINNGFESADSIHLIDAVAGVDKSLNSDPQFVMSGAASLRLSVSKLPHARFSISEGVIEKNISDYEYLSFWIFVDHDKPVSLANTATYQSFNSAGEVVSVSYLNSGIAPKTWTKIKLAKGSAVFEVVKYHLPFNEFVLGGTGRDYNTTINYSVYIDDIRIWKSGMGGESELLIVDPDNNFAKTDIKHGVVGAEYRLPHVIAIGADGNKIDNAKIDVNITGPDGLSVDVSGQTMLVNKAGNYVYEAEYIHKGIVNRLIRSFEMEFLEVESLSLGQVLKGKTYEIPVPELYDLITGAVKQEVATTVSITKPDGGQADKNDFVPDQTGKYIIRYSFSEALGGVTNTKIIELPLWCTYFEGLVADFGSGETAMLEKSELSPSLELTAQKSTVYKPSSNGDQNSLKLTVTEEYFPMFGFSDNWPYATLGDYDFMSMWIYNDYSADLKVILDSSSEPAKELKSKSWTRITYSSANIHAHADLRSGVFTVFQDSFNKSKINANIYIDDIRVFRQGYSREIDFAQGVSTTDYDSTTGQGVRFAVNTDYEADLRVFGGGGELAGEYAEVLSIVNPRGVSLTVTDGRFFRPLIEGIHTLTLTYAKDGILNSATKRIQVLPQMQLSPDEKLLLPYGEAGKTYTFEMPVLYNHGVIDTATDIEFTVYGPDQKEVAVNSNSFVPTVKGLYKVVFFASDSQNLSAYASYETTVGIFAQGKYGVIADFEDGDLSQIQSDKYYFGSVSPFSISEDRAAPGGTKSAKFVSTSNATVNPEFFLTKGNIAGDISLAKAFSFKIYVEDNEHPDRVYNLSKVSYYNFENNWNAALKTGSLSQNIPANKWQTVRIERKDFEEVLGGTIFAGSNLMMGGAYWAEANNDYITCFQVQYFNNGAKAVGMISIYLDDIMLEL